MATTSYAKLGLTSYVNKPESLLPIQMKSSRIGNLKSLWYVVIYEYI